MQNPHPLDAVVNLISNLPRPTDHCKMLCVIDKQLMLVNKTSPPQITHSIITLTPYQLNHGLDTHTWNRIDRKMRTLIAKGELCLIAPAHSQPKNPSSSSVN